MTAVDSDDPNEGDNAHLIYSLQKNAVEGGKSVFAVDPERGVVSTAMCCLDRERASHYSLTLVATDGGGLQGIEHKYTNKIYKSNTTKKAYHFHFQ